MSHASERADAQCRERRDARIGRTIRELVELAPGGPLLVDLFDVLTRCDREEPDETPGGASSGDGQGAVAGEGDER